MCHYGHYSSSGNGSYTPQTMTKTISVRLDDDLAEALEKMSEDTPYDVPKSEVVRTALREHVQRRQAV